MHRTSDFNFELPPGLIAQEPTQKRDDSRLLVVHREEGRLEHRSVRDLPNYVRNGDLLVLNDTRVIPARLLGVKEATGGHVELLLLEEVEPWVWQTLMRCSRRPKPGGRMQFGNGTLRAELLEDGEMGRALVRFESETPFLEALDQIGLPPLPPYIARKQALPSQTKEDRSRYQTVYAREPGAVAAPTAGLHFTPELFSALDAQGVQRASVTLHVGLGTFRPVSVEEITDHSMESERYRLPAATAAALNQTRASGGRVVAVGSTSVRTLESVYRKHDGLIADEGRTDLFIYPPYAFRAVDVMMTNFHLPQSTLIMMVCAFGGTDLIRHAYDEAVREKYRFYSYGDCMLIL